MSILRSCLFFSLLVVCLWVAAPALPQVSPGFLTPVLPAQNAGRGIGTWITSGGAANTTTFAGVNIGAASSDRYVIVCGFIGSASSFTGMTLGGTSMTTVASTSNGTDQLILAALNVTSGTTATLVMSYGGTGAAIFSVYTITHSAHALTPTTATTGNPTITVPFGSFVIGCNADVTQSGRAWTNVTQDVQQNVSIGAIVTASKQFTAGGSNTFNVTYSTNTPVYAWGAFAP